MPIGRANGIKYDVPTAAERGRMSVYIETLRRRLVDLTGRNRLISFRPQKRSSLELLHPDIPAIWRRLMEEEKTWHLIPGIREEDDDEQSKEAVLVEFDEDDCASVAKRGRLAVRANEKNFQASANSIRRQATEVIDETGANHLFLALGFLKWFERSDSEVERLSPLLLIPVTITCTKSQPNGEDVAESSRYDIAHDGNELADNLSLKLRLEEDFGISLPRLTDETELENYLDQVQRVISKKQKWEVVFAAHLAFFSFAKLRMYQDLDPDIWPAGASILDNPLIRELLDGSERVEKFQPTTLSRFTMTTQLPTTSRWFAKRTVHSTQRF